MLRLVRAHNLNHKEIMAKIGSIPAEANSGATLNESTPAEQRKPEGPEVGSGPVRGTKDEYLPASYRTTRGSIRIDR